VKDFQGKNISGMKEKKRGNLQRTGGLTKILGIIKGQMMK